MESGYGYLMVMGLAGLNVCEQLVLKDAGPEADLPWLQTALISPTMLPSRLSLDSLIHGEACLTLNSGFVTCFIALSFFCDMFYLCACACLGMCVDS